MLVLVPQSLLGLSDESLAIISKIICTQFKECNQRISAATKEKKDWRWIKRAKPTRNDVFGMYAKIHSKELQNIIHRYKPVCDELEKKNVIKVNNTYSSDRFPKSYALATQYWNDKLIIHDIGLNANTYIYGNVHTYQGSFQDQYKLCESHVRKFRLPLFSVGKLNAIYDEMEKGGKCWADFGKSTVVNISSRNWWSTICSYGRYHTPLTILDRDVRQCLVCNVGDTVSGFDFKNFQPSLLKFYKRTGVKRRIPTHEASQYFELCKEGELYEFLGEKLGKDNPYKTRTELKQDFCRMLNTKNKHMKTLPVFKCLSQCFPILSEIIYEIKDGKCEEPHKKMAEFLHKLEAEIVFGDIVKSFTERSQAPFFTVHDSAYTTTKNKVLLCDVFNEVLEKRGIPSRVSLA